MITSNKAGVSLEKSDSCHFSGVELTCQTQKLQAGSLNLFLMCETQILLGSKGSEFDFCEFQTRTNFSGPEHL